MKTLFEVETSWVKLLCKFQCWWSELNWHCKHCKCHYIHIQVIKMNLFNQGFFCTPWQQMVHIMLEAYQLWLMKAFFSNVNSLDKEGLNSYPKAVNVPKIIGKVVSLNTFKHKADKLVLYFIYDPFFGFYHLIKF